MLATATLGIHSPKLGELHRLQTRAGRDELGKYIAEGPTLLAEGLAAGTPPEAVFVTDEGLGAVTGLAYDGPVFVVPARGLSKVSDLATPPGVLAVFATPREDVASLLEGGDPALVLAGINDPGNAGTLLRSAEIFGLRSALFVRGGVDAYHPKVVRGAMGAHFRLRLASVDGSRLLELAREHRYRVVAADMAGTPLEEYTFPERLLLAVGNERQGVTGYLAEVDERVAIPHDGRGESLNAAVAGSIILYGRSAQLRARERTVRIPGNA